MGSFNWGGRGDVVKGEKKKKKKRKKKIVKIPNLCYPL